MRQDDVAVELQGVKGRIAALEARIALAVPPTFVGPNPKTTILNAGSRRGSKGKPEQEIVPFTVALREALNLSASIGWEVPKFNKWMSDVDSRQKDHATNQGILIKRMTAVEKSVTAIKNKVPAQAAPRSTSGAAGKRVGGAQGGLPEEELDERIRGQVARATTESANEFHKRSETLLEKVRLVELLLRTDCFTCEYVLEQLRVFA